MSHPAADRNLLFGILALQLNFVDRDQLVAAMNAWALDKAKALGEILVAQGALPAKRSALLDTLVDEHLGQHGDPGKSLAAVGAAGGVRSALASIEDAEVRNTLGRALGATDAAGDGSPDSTRPYWPAAAPGRRYVVLRPHARGGLGEVFVARDEELHREVAFKQIQERFAHEPASRARFVLEAEVTGNLEHPGIVPVYGFGHYEDGRPFYAMRFIKGESLKDAIRRFHQADHASAGQRSLELRKLLSAFIAVCQAIHYAHSRGVLHRDLKPDNVMIGKFGETLVVDWGLAKPLDRPDADAERSLTGQPLRPASGGSGAGTVAGSALGTPAYMSPEQADGRLDGLTAASDVYSLGASLYFLLTGRGPFRGETADVLRHVRAGEFPPPRVVNSGVPAALEAVCLKAMSLCPKDRYLTARDLSEDLEHWLADEPVAAYREPVPARLARWGRRHRPLVAGAAALLLTAVVALAAGLVLLGQARARTDHQRRLAEANFAEAQRQRDLARDNFRMARRAVDENFVQISENTLLKSPLPGLQPLRKQLLESALKYYQEFLRRSGGDPELQAGLGQAYFRVGTITEEIGAKADAVNAFERARDLYASIIEAEPANAAVGSDLARTYRALGRVQFRLDRLPEATASFQRAIALGEKLVSSGPGAPECRRDLAWSYNNLAAAYRTTGQPAAAEDALARAIATWEDLIRRHPAAEYRESLGQVFGNRCWWLAQAGQNAEAVSDGQRAVALCEEAARGNDAAAASRHHLAAALDNLGSAYLFAGQPAKAQAAYQRAVAVGEPLARENPVVLEYQEKLISYNIDLCHLCLQTGQDAEAQKCFERALELRGKQPDVPPTFFDNASLGRARGKLLRKRGRTSEALAALKKAAQTGEANPGERPYSTYELACARALCSAFTAQAKSAPAAAQEQDDHHYADRAMEALRQAVAEGWGNVAWMEKDTDLNALRDRPDFRKLVEGLRQQAKKTTKGK